VITIFQEAVSEVTQTLPGTPDSDSPQRKQKRRKILLDKVGDLEGNGEDTHSTSAPHATTSGVDARMKRLVGYAARHQNWRSGVKNRFYASVVR
jgi:hypothetical protein